jgi:membrane associated rhomboid family serine protease
MFRSIPTVTKNIVIANVIVFAIQFLMSPYEREVWEFGALWPLDSGNFKIWQPITTMFMHGNIGHIFFNMFTFVQFGSALEYTWGQKRFFQFYMICGIIASIVFILVTSGNIPAVGASGAVMGVLVGFAMLYPDRELMLIFIPVPIKAKYFIGALVAIDLFSEVSGRSDGIAHWAHLGGAAAGAALVYIYGKTGSRRY